MPGQHAKLSPSSSAMWIACPASISMKAKYPTVDNDSIYAREGTIAHALAELEAGLFFGLISKTQYNAGMKAWRAEFDAQGYDPGTLEEMQVHVRGYVELIKERLKRRPMTRLFLEQRLDSGIPTCWGTSDAVLVSPTHIEIIDLKYGAGIQVSAIENSQLRIYGLGALDTYGDLLGDVDTVYTTVYQPRVDNTSTEELTADDLRAWRQDVALPAADEALNAENPRFGPSEKACKWCPAAGFCTARVEKTVVEDFGSPYAAEPAIPVAAEVMTPEQLGLVLERIPAIKAWCADVEKYALEKAYSRGENIPGWKVVLSGGRRGITDDAAAIQTLIDAGFKAEQVATFKAKGIGDLEKLVGKKELPTLLGDLLAKSRGRESLVPESDKREAITPALSAADDFGGGGLI